VPEQPASADLPCCEVLFMAALPPCAGAACVSRSSLLQSALYGGSAALCRSSLRQQTFLTAECT